MIQSIKKAALTAGGQSWERAERELPPPHPAPAQPVLPGLGGHDPPEPRQSPASPARARPRCRWKTGCNKTPFGARVAAGKGGGVAGSCWAPAAGSASSGERRVWGASPLCPCLPRSGHHCPGEVTSQEGEPDPHRVLCASPRALPACWGQKGTLVPSRVWESHPHQAVKVL